MDRSILRIKSRYLSLFFVASFILTSTSTVSAQSSGRLEFSPNLLKGQVDDTLSTEILLDTGGVNALGADTRIYYDPQVIEVTKVEAGSIFGDYPLTAYDNAQGLISISGIAVSNDRLFNGKGVFATVYWHSLASGQSIAYFEFEEGSTKDSNIAILTGNKDGLGSVNSLTFTIGGQGTAERVEPVNTTQTVNPAPDSNNTQTETNETTQPEDTSSAQSSSDTTSTADSPSVIKNIIKSVGSIFGKTDTEAEPPTTGFGQASEDKPDTDKMTAEEKKEYELYGPLTASDARTDIDEPEVITDIPEVKSDNLWVRVVAAVAIILALASGVFLVFWQQKHKTDGKVIKL